MLTFEEFFKKKKIDIAALQQGEPALFSEFVTHYDRMGEKSFDHTKKYWFNKLRKHYHLAPEIKVEPLRNENQLAEQTVTDSLTTPAENAPKQGFTPRFKANPPKPADQATPAESNTDKPAEQGAPKPGFTPRFKANVTKSAEPTPPVDNPTDKPAEQEPKKPGFTPRFKAGVTKPAEPTPPVENVTDKPAEQEPKKPGFTPRFKAGVTKPAEPTPPAESITDKPVAQDTATENAADTPAAPKKPGFTPRFKAGVTKPAESTPPAESSADKPVEATLQAPAIQQAQPGEKTDAVSPEEANVPEIDFTGKFTPKPAPEHQKPVDEKLIKLAEQADRLASDFKNNFRATHLPKNVARLTAEEKPEIPQAPEAAKKKEVDAEKIAYKPRFNAKKLPPKPPQE